MAERTRFPGIHPSEFEHPWDRSALQALRKAPGFDLVLKKLSGVYLERIVRLAFTANSVRLSPSQCPELYRLLPEAAGILDVSEPEFYLLQDPYPNAMAFGMERHTIVITS